MSASSSGERAGGPLAGLTVLSIEQAVAAPYATRQLADLGARVIKIERDAGDFARGYDTAVDGESSYFVWLNRGKESVTADLKSERGRQLVRSIAAHADVFVQNLAPGALQRLHLDPRDLQAENPRLITASISGYGAGGPYADKKAYDLLIQCESGLLSVTGTPEAPSKAGISIADIAAGMFTYSGILAALFERERTGSARALEISMLEALGEWMSQPYLFAQYGGQPPARAGAHHASIAPYGPYPTADGTIFLAVQNEREWAALCRVVLDDAIASDARFASNVDRVTHRAALDEVLQRAFASMPAAAAAATLDSAGIANAELRDMHGYAAHPQLEARERWRMVDTPSIPARSSLPPVDARGWTYEMGAVPAIGQHTEQVFAEFLSGTKEESR